MLVPPIPLTMLQSGMGVAMEKKLAAPLWGLMKPEE